MDDLSPSRPTVGRAGGITLIAPGGPTYGRGTEQQDQYGKRHGAHGYAKPWLMRAHREVPRHGQQEQLGDHRQPAAPTLSERQRASGGEHHAADQNEPD